MINRLWSYDPPLAEDEIDHRIGQFDTAVARIEDDVVEVFATMEPPVADRVAPTTTATTIATTATPRPSAERGSGYDPTRTPMTRRCRSSTRSAMRSAPSTKGASRSSGRSAERGRVADEPEPSEVAPYDEDLAGWSGSGTRRTITRRGLRPARQRRRRPGLDRARPATRQPARSARRRAVRAQRPGPGQGPAFVACRPGIAEVASPHADRRRSRCSPSSSSPAGLAAPAARVAAGDRPVVLETEVPGGVSDPTPRSASPRKRSPSPAASRSSTARIRRCSPATPTIPVRFDGEFARIATSVASAGAKVDHRRGPVEPSRRPDGAGHDRRALGARERRLDACASPTRAASRSATGRRRTSRPSSRQLGLVWRVPVLRTSPSGDYIIIEPGIPGSGHRRRDQVGEDRPGRSVARRAQPRLSQPTSRSVASCMRSALLAKQSRMKPLPASPKAVPGASPILASSTRRNASAAGVVLAVDGEEEIEGASRLGEARPAARGKPGADDVPPRPRPVDLHGKEFVALVERHGRGALHEGRDARGRVLDEVLDGLAERRRGRKPADPPAGHRPVLGEGVDEENAVVRVGDVVERRRARAGIVEAVIDLVGDDEEATLTRRNRGSPEARRGLPSSRSGWRAS